MAGPDLQTHEHWMQAAIEVARQALPEDVPVGAVLLYQNEVIAEACNRRERELNPVGHAELLAMQAGAKKLGQWRLLETVLYVTLEPCPMCASAIQQARVGQVIFGAYDPVMGACGSRYSLLKEGKTEGQETSVIGGVYADPCGDLLRQFFQDMRQKP
jgi:tRNA(adenine34) deaminase